MKIYYFNDTNENQRVYIKNLMGDPVILKPASGDFFELPLKENEIPFIKTWKFQVLIGSAKEGSWLEST